MPDLSTTPPLPWPLPPALVAPPFFYVTGEETLKLSSRSIAAGVTLTIAGRICRPDGGIEPFSQDQIANSDGSEKTTIVNLGTGWLLNLDVFASAGSPAAIECPVQVLLMRGATSAGIEVGCIVQGYVTTTQRVIWPGFLGAGVLPTNPNSRIRMIVGTDPAAGVEIFETVPAGKRWRLQLIRYTLVTSPTVANRETKLIIDDGSGNVACRYQMQSAQAASNTFQYTWAIGTQRATPTASPGDIDACLPSVILGPGQRFGTETLNLQAGDNYGAPVYLVEEFSN